MTNSMNTTVYAETKLKACLLFPLICFRLIRAHLLYLVMNQLLPSIQ